MDPYEILGVSRNATDDEIKARYRELVRKYHPDNYGADNPLLDLANEKMGQINDAYDAILKERKEGSRGWNDGSSFRASDATGVYAEVRKMLNSHRFREAEKILADVPKQERTADWHYLESILLMKRGRTNDAMRELEIATTMDPGNIEYQKAKEMFNGRKNSYGDIYYGTGGRPATSREDDICEFCIRLKMLDCLCECMGGDLIPCC